MGNWTKEMLKRQKKKEDISCYLILVRHCVFFLKKKCLTASLEEDSSESVYLTFNRWMIDMLFDMLYNLKQGLSQTEVCHHVII